MKKQTSNILLIGGGAAVLAYLIFAKKPSAPGTPVTQSTGLNLSDVFTGVSSAFKSLFPSVPVPSGNGAANPANVSLAPVSDNQPSVSSGYQLLPTTAPDVLPTSYYGGKPLQYGIPDVDGISGFAPITGTGLAVLCGMGCIACMGNDDAQLGRIGKFDWTSLIIPAAVVGGGYLLLKKVGIFSNANSSNNSAIDAAVAQTTANGIANAKAAGINQTVSDSQLQSAATDIYNKAISSDVDQDSIVYDVIQVNTITDLLRLKQLYGTKQVNAGSMFSTCSLLGLNCQSIDLDGTLKASLDAGHIAEINNFLSATGINYKF